MVLSKNSTFRLILGIFLLLLVLALPSGIPGWFNGLLYMCKSRLIKLKQDRLIEHFVADTTARCSAGLVGINFKTAIFEGM
jgi:hypothetical protein